MRCDLGLVGYGEVGYRFSLGFKQAGLSVVAYDVAPDRVAKRAAEADVVLLPTLEELIKSTDLIIACVWPAGALSVATDCAGFLKPGQMYADVSSVSPVTVERLGAAIRQSGADFVKLAIMAAIPDYGFQAPILAGGEKAEELAEKLKEYGMKVRTVGTDPRQPAAIKILRSIGLKGIVVLVYEMLLAARKYGVEEEVFTSASETLDAKSFKTTLDAWIASTAIHAARRAGEMDEAIQTVVEAGLTPVMSEAAKKVYRDIADYHLEEVFRSEIPSSYVEVLRQIEMLEAKKGVR